MGLSRRQLLQGCSGAAAASLVAGGATLFARTAAARPAQALRPPGALDEEKFLGACVRCGLCVRDCPPQNLRLADWSAGVGFGVAVGTPKGLVVPVIREADRMNLSEIEGQIAAFGKRARDGKLGIEDMQGGTFTISNGGVYGSMLSTPILNAPQSGILGMHRIEQRPIVLKDGSIAARPMMYLALSYDHRIVDGREAVTFLVRVKECLEDPQRFVLEV